MIINIDNNNNSNDDMKAICFNFKFKLSSKYLCEKFK